MRTEAIVLITVITPVLLVASQTPQDKIPVFVRSVSTVGGFTDPSKAREDSVKDLKKKLKDSKLVSLTESETDALVALEVLTRETQRESNLGTGLFGSRQNRSYLAVRLTAGEYTTEFEGQSGSKGVLTGYGAAAGNVVKQLEAWLRSNRDQLLALKK